MTVQPWIVPSGSASRTPYRVPCGEAYFFDPPVEVAATTATGQAAWLMT